MDAAAHSLAEVSSSQPNLLEDFCHLKAEMVTFDYKTEASPLLGSSQSPETCCVTLYLHIRPYEQQHATRYHCRQDPHTRSGLSLKANICQTLP